MEQWERDYLENITSKNKTPSKRKKIKIDRRWKEVIQPDGSKLYVPRPGAFRKQRIQKLNQFRLGVAIKKAEKAILILLMAVVLLFGLVSFKKLKTDSSISQPSFIPGLHARNTYINGLGLKNMADILWDIKEKQTDTLNAYVSGGYAFSEDEITAWQDSISKDLNTIENLTYDKSYLDVIEGYKSLMCILRDYISYELAGNSEKSVASHSEYSSLLPELHYIFAEALEKNGVEYTLDEIGLTFVYYDY